MVKPRLVVTSRILSIYNICVLVKHNPIHTSLYQIISGIYKQNEFFLKLYKTLLKIQKFNIANIANNVKAVSGQIFMKLFQDTQNSLNFICSSDSNSWLHGFCFLVI